MTRLGMCTATLLANPMAASDDEIRAAAEAAVTAGCTALSVWAGHLAALGDPVDFGASVAVVEAATAWAGDDEAAAAAEAAIMGDLAAVHGAAVVAAVTMEPVLADVPRARSQLARLVERAEQAGAVVCVEFLPWSGIPTLAAAWDLVEPLGEAAGILLDTWHWQRQPGGPDPTLLGTIPRERIGYVQLCDAAAEPVGDSLTEAMSSRLLPGDGVVDFVAVLDIVEAIGAAPFVATEIFNPAFVAERGSAAAAQAMVDATFRTLPRYAAM